MRDAAGNRTTFSTVGEALVQSPDAVRIDVGAGSYDERVELRDRAGLTGRPCRA